MQCRQRLNVPHLLMYDPERRLARTPAPVNIICRMWYEPVQTIANRLDMPLPACGHACPLIIIIKSKHLNACPAHRFKARPNRRLPFLSLPLQATVARHVCLPCSDLQVLLKSKLSNVRGPLVLQQRVATTLHTLLVACCLLLVAMREKLCVRAAFVFTANAPSTHLHGSSSLTADWIALHATHAKIHFRSNLSASHKHHEGQLNWGVGFHLVWHSSLLQL